MTDEIKTVKNTLIIDKLIVSIDIGGKNYAICIQRRSKESKPNVILWEKWTVLEGKQVTLKTLSTLTDKFNEILPLLKNSDHILIEKQKNKNYKAMKLEQHTITYMMLMTKAKIIEVPASVKYRILDAPKKMTAYKRKKWGVVKTLEMLPDYKGKINIIENTKKKDDLADSFIQLEACVIKYKLLDK